ncbi:PaaI family thioesterase [Pelagibius sp. Alg239-R121]|uniref:PaaI family thioesterase n=1 Tax=Pelagibius sp. Alg239-R121 TaxID=2993448 RepID=UPI0024A798AE|nr:PaaI family thioesterase [Pelagibius sp. Alg239-R121]
MTKDDQSSIPDTGRIQGGFADLVDYQLHVWREDYAEVVLDVRPQHLNRSGVLHGGAVSTLIDTACGYAGCYCTVEGNFRRALTLSLETQFIGAITEGKRVTVIGRKTGGGRSIFFSTAEVRDQNGTLLAQGTGTFKYRRGSENPEGVPAEAPKPLRARSEKH